MDDKERIRQIFKGGGTMCFSDIAEETGLDLPTVVKICLELIEGKEVGVVIKEEE